MRTWRFGLKGAAALVAAVTAVGLSGTGAWAAPPLNDVYSGAAAITALPFETTQDTTQATVDGVDAQITEPCNVLVAEATVWFEHTATSDGFLVADTSGSSYSAGIAVATGAPGNFVVQTCGLARKVWMATAGVTYVLLVFDDQGGAGNGGTLRLTVEEATNLRSNDFTGDGNADVVSRDETGRLYVYPGNGSGGWKPRIAYGWGWNAMTAILAPGDWDGDGHADLMARDKAGYLWLYRGDSASRFGAALQIGRGWNSMTAIVGVGDFNGDMWMDLVSRDTSGRLYLYRGDGSGGFLPTQSYGTGWNVMTAMLGIGDFDGNDAVDLVARDNLGKLWLYPGRGDGTWMSRRAIGTGWQGFTALVAPQDLSGDDNPDVLARTSAGYLFMYQGNGAGYWNLPAKLVGWGWNRMTAIVS